MSNTNANDKHVLAWQAEKIISALVNKLLVPLDEIHATFDGINVLHGEILVLNGEITILLTEISVRLDEIKIRLRKIHVLLMKINILLRKIGVLLGEIDVLIESIFPQPNTLHVDSVAVVAHSTRSEAQTSPGVEGVEEEVDKPQEGAPFRQEGEEDLGG